MKRLPIMKVRRLRLETRGVVFKKLLRFHCRANQGDILNPVVPGKHSDNLSFLIIDRTARVAVAGINFRRPILLPAQYVRTIKNSVTDHLVSVGPSDDEQLLVLAWRRL